MKFLSPSIRKFLFYAKPYRWLVVGATICGLLKFNIPLIFPWILKDIINQLLSPKPAIVQHINYSMLVLILFYILWMVVTFFRSYLADQAGQRLIFDLRHEFYTHLQRMSLNFYERRQVGSIASRLFGDIAIAQNLVGASFTNTIMDLSSLILISTLLFHMSWKLALMSITIFPFYIFLNRYFKARIKKTSQLAQEKMEGIAGEVNEKLGGISIIQSFTHEEAEAKRFLRENKTYLFYRLANVKDNAMATSIIGFLTSIAPVIVVWYGAMQVIKRDLTVGELTAFYAYLGMFYQPLNRLTELNILLANSTAAIDRIFDIFSTSPEIVDSTSAKEVNGIKGEIKFENVSFSYEPSRRALKHINVYIPACKTVALVGVSGSGKSTFVKLLPRFYDVTSGSITIDGINIRNITLRSLRKYIALVPQDPILFSGTISENILFGRPSASEEDIQAAAKMANAHDFIKQLPMGYQTQIGEGGVKLSGGQRQRLALARSFLKDAPILILDEATSALDSESENLIQQALQKLMKGRTTLIIAHRLSTIQMVDEVIVFHQGQIVEEGNHQELLSKSKGLYRKLYDEQYNKFLQFAYS